MAYSDGWRVVTLLLILGVSTFLLFGSCDMLNGLLDETEKEESEDADGSENPDGDAADGDGSDESDGAGDSDADGESDGGPLRVTTPDDNDTWRTGDRETIEWTGAVDGDTVDIDLYDRGSWHTNIVDDTENDGSYSWSIPSDLAASTFYSIFVASDTTDAEDESEQFSLELAPYITVVRPNGGESWGEGYTKTISWESSGAGDFVEIELYYGGSRELTITSSTANDGSYSWDVNCYNPQPANPDSYDPDYRAKIISKSNPSIYDFSDSYFEIWD